MLEKVLKDVQLTVLMNVNNVAKVFTNCKYAHMLISSCYLDRTMSIDYHLLNMWMFGTPVVNNWPRHKD